MKIFRLRFFSLEKFFSGSIFESMQMIPEQFKTIAVAAPAGPLAVERFTDGVNWLRATGKMLRIMPHVNGPSSARYLAASAEARAADLSAAWLDPEVDLLLAARGGFGSAQLLELLDWRRLAARPLLPVVGYSDITALHWAMISRNAGSPLVGPMLGKLLEAEHSSYTVRTFRAALERIPMELPPAPEFGPFQVWNRGTASGLPLPGNLAVAVTLCGTPFCPDPAGKILLFEDLNEPAYKLDRYLTQLRQNGFFRRAAGVIFGQFLDCAPREELNRLFQEVADEVRGPVLSNFPFGHLFPLACLNCRMPLTVEGDRVFTEA